MAYLGRTPVPGEIIVLDSIESQFNGSTTSFSLTRQFGNSTVSFYPATSEQLIVSLGGVIQKVDRTGNEGFYINADQIVFAVAPAAGVKCFILSFGGVLDIGAPGDNTVTSNKIANGSVTPVKLSTGGPYWDTAGNVGIGTTSPSAPLVVQSDVNSVSAIFKLAGTTATSNYHFAFGWADNSLYHRMRTGGGSNDGFIIEARDAKVSQYFAYSGDWYLYNSGSISITSTSTGNVGIGSTAPDQKLVVNGTLGFSYGIGNTTYQQIKRDGDSLRFQSSSSGISTTTVFSFGNTTSTYLAINGTGRVGIGTTNPTTTLTLGGTAPALSLTHNFPATNVVGAEISSIRFGDSDPGRESVAIISAHNDGGWGSNNAATAIYFKTAQGGTVTASERVRISSGGNVGIGTTSPNARLHVYTVNNTTGLEIGIGTNANYTFTANSNSGYTTNFNMDAYGLKIGHNSGGRDIRFATNSTDRMTISAAGLVGIGTTNPLTLLHIIGGAATATIESVTNTAYVSFKNTLTTGSLGLANSDINFVLNNTERLRITSTGRILIGTTTERSNYFSGSPSLQIEGISTAASQLSIVNNTANANPSTLTLGKTRNNGTVSGMTTVISGDYLGRIHFAGSNGTDFKVGAEITSQADGTVSGTNFPGNIIFSTNDGNDFSPTQRVIINSSGHLIPATDATYDLGSTTNSWRNIYTNDLNLSNEKMESGNDVDGTKGNWTIQEGENDLYIINNKNGKKYRFALEEIA